MSSSDIAFTGELGGRGAQWHGRATLREAEAAGAEWRKTSKAATWHSASISSTLTRSALSYSTTGPLWNGGQRQDIFGEPGQTQSVLPDLICLYPSECIFR
jgi:hypothetical protein